MDFLSEILILLKNLGKTTPFYSHKKKELMLKKHTLLLKKLSGLLLVVLMLVLTGCPYKSSVPIGPTEEKVEEVLLGKWIKAKDVSQENPEYFEIKKFANMEYEIDKWTYNSYDSAYSMERYISHTTTIDENIFLNMQKDGAGNFYLYKIEFSAKDLKLFEITENIDESFNTSNELKAFVQANMNLSFFYSKDEVRYVKRSK